MAVMHNPPHPGEILGEWLDEFTVTLAAKKIGVTRVALSRILNGNAGISPEMDLRLSDALGTTQGMWLGLQADYDLWKARKTYRKKAKRLVHRSAEVAAAERARSLAA